ncbi:unnamed protein product [Phaedon cochleariae]|uniref:E3 ubiquitin-protein ligase Sina-like RING finger domain-containing protein n=1 Tax=Phaedon cochleariae TaxID=80249 RepID=A0A9P0DG38_PHACE|nr:unnamed protein product [Phaedon cochleariae]
MAESLELQDALLSMKCCLCKNYLSVPPIISISEDGKQLKCGRCEKIKKPLRTRNFAFENIVKFFKFPCIYDDCNEMIPWEDVERHEDICEKKTISCPIHYVCEDIVQVQNLEEHMRKNHGSNCFSDGYLTAEVNLNRHIICSVISNNQQFLVSIQHNISTPEVYVASLNSINECFTYNLKLSSISEDSYSLLIENQPINKYDDRGHCFGCIMNKCCVLYHPHSTVNGNIPVTVNYMKIDPTHIKHVLGDISKMKYTIEIHPKKDLEENDNDLANENLTVKSQTNNSTIVDLLRKQLQCPICMEYMNGNIYNCEIGHVVCDVCKIQLTKCPACQTKIGESRNLPLEDLADEIVFACSFFKNGCEFTGNLKLLPQHEENCDQKQQD